ncbi:MAG: ligase-associated DNA damage response DEXH box helicase [Bdellovibrionaceae bacterium]|nr:ligase-associated DNA damage response DEXH box helicase [Pseudobdellovibrionaceae bacterium]
MKDNRAKELKPVRDFFKARGWKAFPFQEQLWRDFLDGRSGLLNVPTGAGKTYAAVMGPFAKFLAHPKKGLKALYISPLRALARDLELALKEPIERCGWPLRVETRTGDTPSAMRRKQLKNPPDILLTTPESLAVMISQTEGDELLKDIEVVILDEWHELMATKRGSLMELCLSHLRFLNPDLQTWALSASVGNLEQAAQVAVGPRTEPVIVTDRSTRIIDIECLLPQKIDSFPWTGHLGFALRDPLIHKLDQNESTLIFTNTRSQAERWFEALRESVPDMAEKIAIHHGSLDRKEREFVEEGVKSGVLKWIVCTSSLDLGVDFQPVEKVVQIGSPKMVARFMQRAGRSAHRPGAASKLLFVPTNSWEILELEALRKALDQNRVESRPPIHKPIDVLLQHMLTLAAGPGFRVDELTDSLKDTVSFASVSREELNWCLTFLTRGGETLKAYPQFHKLSYDQETGRYVFLNPKFAALHRMSIGTIVSSEMVKVSFTNRKNIGSVEEGFISRLKKGDVFQFAGKKLEFVLLKDMTAYVKSSSEPTNTVPSFGGNRFPMSEILGQAFRETLQDRHPGLNNLLRPLLDAQAKISALPKPDELLIETWSSSKGEHLFVFPFEGRLVHEGLSQLWAHRFAARKSATFSFSINEYGFEILGPVDYDFVSLFDQNFFSDDTLIQDMGESLHLSQLSQRQFREIASIAGLVFTGYPGNQKTGRQMQISSSLLYEVFRKHEPNNLLIRQSKDEVLQGSLESERIGKVLRRLGTLKVLWQKVEHPSPLSFPLFVEMGNANRLSNETLEMKVARLRKSWEKSL